jgi:hypothetical protein
MFFTTLVIFDEMGLPGELNIGTRVTIHSRLAGFPTILTKIVQIVGCSSRHWLTIGYF